VGWDGKHVAVADSKASVIYRFEIAGSAGTRVGVTAPAGGAPTKKIGGLHEPFGVTLSLAQK
jgi:hypothetical protein